MPQQAPDLARARESLSRMLKANPDTGMEVPQSEASLGAASDLLRAVFGGPNVPTGDRQPRFELPDDMDPRLAADILRAWQTHPELVESVNWSGDRIPEQGTRAFLMPGGGGFFGGGKDRVNLSPEFKNQIDNVWHELSHKIGLEDFKRSPDDITAHDVTEASRRVNRPRDINLPRVQMQARSNALKEKLK